MAGCLTLALLIALDLIELHGPDGQTAYVNAHEISTLRAPNSTDLGRSFARGVHCIVSTTNGKFIAATEPCTAIRDRLIATGK